MVFPIKKTTKKASAFAAKTGLNKPAKGGAAPTENSRAGAMAQGYSPKGFPNGDAGKPVGTLKGATKSVGKPGVSRPAAGGAVAGAMVPAAKKVVPGQGSKKTKKGK